MFIGAGPVFPGIQERLLTRILLARKPCVASVSSWFAKILVVRRWILLLLLAVLPLQFAQAAAASYCAHEKTVTTKHVGHHEHEHQQIAGEAAGSTDADTGFAQSGSADPDCGYCHLSCAQPLGFVSAPWVGTRERPAGHGPTLTFASHDGQDVERPKWTSAARSAGGRASPTP